MWADERGEFATGSARLGRVELSPDAAPLKTLGTFLFAAHVERAIDAMRVALDVRYGVSDLREDDDLDALRGLPGFQTLLDSAHKDWRRANAACAKENVT